MIPKLMGSGTFCRLTGINGPKLRLLEAAGIVAPDRSDKGWRLFTAEDVEKVRAHLAADRRQRRA